MINNKRNEKGSILLMSAVLLSVITIIGTLIIAVFFRGYINVSREINYEKSKLAIQVEAQEYLAFLDIDNLPEEVIYNEELGTYTFVVENERFKVTVTLDDSLNIIGWRVKE